MKNLVLILIIYATLLPTLLYPQDTLSISELKELTTRFAIEDGDLIGNGAEFLKSEMSSAQFTILGDYGPSRQVSELVDALLPTLNRMDYNTMAVDVGPVSTSILTQLPHCNKNITNAIETLNNRYGFKEDGRLHLPMPVLAAKEEALYVRKAMELNWNLIGLNNDSWNGLIMLLDELDFNMGEKEDHKPIFTRAREALSNLYNKRDGDLLKFAKDFREDNEIQDFLRIAETNEKNRAILESIQYSLKKSEQYAQKDYYAKNRDRIPYEKKILREQLEEIDFDINKDKLLVKIFRRHAAKGFQPDGFYGFANTLQEIAAYNGNKSIHIGFFRRFHMEEGELKDEMKKDYYVRDRYRDVIQMGSKMEWTIVDLRPLIEGSYYSGKYQLNPWIQNLMKQYDIIIIPPIDGPLTPNHQFTSK